MKVIFQVWLDVCAGEKFIWACLWYRFKHLNCMGMKYPNSTRHWHFHWSQNIECFSYRISMMMKMVKMNWRSWCCFLQIPSSRLLFCVNTLIGGVMGQFGWMDPPPDSWWLPWWWWWVGALDLNNLFNLSIIAWINLFMILVTTSWHTGWSSTSFLSKNSERPAKTWWGINLPNKWMDQPTIEFFLRFKLVLQLSVSLKTIWGECFDPTSRQFWSQWRWNWCHGRIFPETFFSFFVQKTLFGNNLG